MAVSKIKFRDLRRERAADEEVYSTKLEDMIDLLHKLSAQADKQNSIRAANIKRLGLDQFMEDT